MKHLPNLLTLANLFCGCMATAYIFSEQPFLSNFRTGGPNWDWVHASSQIYMGSFLILAAAIFDMLDGFAARALNVFSPIGKDLDSLADVVSFGVAPGAIMYKLLWHTYMMEPNALEVSMLAMSPAFLIACFGALRLARYNVTASTQKGVFTGLPIPAVGIVIASLPLIAWFNTDFGPYLQNKWVLYGIIALMCFLMVSKIKFFKLMPSSFQIKNMWPQIILLIAAIGGGFAIQAAIIPVLFILYVILSFIYKPAEA